MAERTGCPANWRRCCRRPEHFEQASELVTPEHVSGSSPVGPDPSRPREAAQAYVDAGFDEVYVAQIGPAQDEFFDFWRTKVRL